MNNKTLFIHAGQTKTGTTAIQNYLYNELSASDYCYLEDGDPNSSLLVLRAFKLDLANVPTNRHRNYTAKKIEKIQSSARKRFRNMMSRADKPKAILSAENISFLKPPECEDLLSTVSENFDSIKLLLYIRPIKSRLESVFQEMLKMRYVSLKHEHKINFRHSIGKFDRIFGEENVTLRRFSRDDFPQGNIICDFLEQIGIVNYQDVSVSKNESLSLPAVQLLYIYRKQFPIRDPSDEYLIEALKLISGPKFHMHSDLFTEVAQVRGDSIRWLEQRAGFLLDEDIGAKDRYAVRHENDLLTLDEVSIEWLDKQKVSKNALIANDYTLIAKTMREIARKMTPLLGIRETLKNVISKHDGR